MKNFTSYKKLVFCLFLTNQCLCAPIVDPTAAIQFRPSVLTLPNKVTVLNIPTPNSSGLSHLKFKEFSVLAYESLVWNNSTTAGSSVLAGLLDPNLNLLFSGSASTILNEVTSLGFPSALNGKFEIFGSKAHLIIINPSGLSINGSSFINTASLNFVAGTLNPDYSYNINSNISVGGSGLDALDTDSLNFFALAFTNSGSINGPNAKTNIPDISVADLHSINPNVQAGRIFVPTNLEPSFKASDWEIVNGQLRIKADSVNNSGSINANNNLIIQSNSLTNSGSLKAENELVLEGNLNNSGFISSKSNMFLRGDWLLNTGAINSENNLNIYLSGLN